MFSVIAVERLLHGDSLGRGQGNKAWYPGRVVAATADRTYSIEFDDGDFESGVRRENVRHIEGDASASRGGELLGGGGTGCCASERKRSSAQAQGGVDGELANTTVSRSAGLSCQRARRIS